MFASSASLWVDLLVFALGAVVVGIAGVRVARYGDRLADRTELGEALVGTLFLGSLTALPGLVASVTTALKGHAGLAIGNAIGGIAAQTVALALADMAHPRVNLEHAAASATNLLQTVLLVLLLSIVLGGLSSPDATVLHVHPATVVLLLVAAAAFRLVWRARGAPMWIPRSTPETVEDRPDPKRARESVGKLVFALVASGLLTSAGGVVVAESAANLVVKTGAPEALVGGLCMALVTSLPEIVTSIAAVRRGALTLAVSDVVGGNFFDVLFIAAADLAYLDGSLFHASGVTRDETFLLALTLLLNVVLLAGLVYRQKRGPANIGIESAVMLFVYVAGWGILAFAS